MTWTFIDNVQRAVTPKASNSELFFLCFTNCIMVIYICIKFQENTVDSFKVTDWTQIYYRNHYFQSSKDHNSKTRLTRVRVLVFCTSSYDAFTCVKFHKNIWNDFQLTERTEYRVEMAIFETYYVQK